MGRYLREQTIYFIISGMEAKETKVLRTAGKDCFLKFNFLNICLIRVSRMISLLPAGAEKRRRK